MSLGPSEHGIFGLVVHPDGSVTRNPVPRREADGVTSFDVKIEVPGRHSLAARIFLPKQKPEKTKLPLVVFFHGGGFVLFRSDTFFYHELCERVADFVESVVVSVDYRLAPELKLPAAFQDGDLALHWLQAVEANSALCPLLAIHADFSRCFMIGDSAGANLIHNVAVKRGGSAGAFVKGAVLLQPFFGGEKRKASEVKMKEDKYLPLVANDLLWKLALPEGSDRDCESCNPGVSSKTDRSEEGGRLNNLMILVVVGGRDPMRDRQLEYAERIKSCGGDVKLIEYDQCSHGFMVMSKEKPAHAQAQALLLEELKDFIVSNSGRGGRRSPQISSSSRRSSKL